MRATRSEIMASMNDCLIDLSDAGFFVESRCDVTDRCSSIDTPENNGHRFMARIGNPDGQWKYYGANPLAFPTEQIIGLHEGWKTFKKMEQSLHFLCSYIPDLYMDVDLVMVQLRFRDSKYNTAVSIDGGNAGAYVNHKIGSYLKSSEYLFDKVIQKSHQGLTNSDLIYVYVIFDRPIPNDVKKWEDIMSENKKKRDLLRKKQTWFKKLKNKIYGIFK